MAMNHLDRGMGELLKDRPYADAVLFLAALALPHLRVEESCIPHRSRTGRDAVRPAPRDGKGERRSLSKRIQSLLEGCRG